MPENARKTRGLGALPLALGALIVGWAGGRMSDAGSQAHAQARENAGPLQRLLIEDEIRQRIGLYGLYADGDGPGGQGRNLRALADTLMTPDVVSEIHPANGAPVITLKGRDVVARSPAEVDPDRAKRIAGRHYLVNTVFDSVTPTTAETRTTAVYFDATRNLVGPKCHAIAEGDCGGVPVKTIMWIYQMSWRATSQGWQIAKNTLRDDN